MIMGRRTRFCRSRTLPGQPRRVIALRPGAPHRIDPAIFGGKPDQGFLHEGGEIYPTLPQRWQIEQHHRQPEEQVLPEAPFGDPLFQVGIGGATIGVSIWKSSPPATVACLGESAAVSPAPKPAGRFHISSSSAFGKLADHFEIHMSTHRIH
jgi:hypothetical protein